MDKKFNVMKSYSTKKILMLMVAAALLCPLGVSAQTLRGDYNYDGSFNISDLSALIGYVLNDEWNDEPLDLERDTITVNGVSFVMVHVEGGMLTRSDGGMYAINDFWICKTEVTIGLWAAVMGGYPRTPQNPLSMHSWNDCQEFIDKLNAYTGRQFRFPTCNEWEYAARGGNRSNGYTYCGGNRLDVVGWYKGNCSKNMPVGLLKCNELGLYDMSGNLSEWCQDAYSSQAHYRCGGNYYEDAASNTPSMRRYSPNSSAIAGIGFRLAM